MLLIFKNDFGKLVLCTWIIPFLIFLILSEISGLLNCPIAWEHTKGVCKSAFIDDLPIFQALLFYLVPMAIPNLAFLVIAIMRVSKQIKNTK